MCSVKFGLNETYINKSISLNLRQWSSQRRGREHKEVKWESLSTNVFCCKQLLNKRDCIVETETEISETPNIIIML